MAHLLENIIIKDYIKNFIEAELTLPSQSEHNQDSISLHRENGKAIFGDSLDEVIDFIHKSIAIQKKLNGHVHEKTVDILATMFDGYFSNNVCKTFKRKKLKNIFLT